MVRVISHAYTVGTFQGHQFKQVELGGVFVGVAEVPADDMDALRWFERRSAFTVEWPTAPTTPPEPPAPAPDLDGLTLSQLREYAAENGIDLGSATRKADVLAVIQAAS